MRNQLLANSSFIGKDLSQINENVFFHYMENADSDDVFNEYLIDLWKTYNTSSFYKNKPKMLHKNVLNDYKVVRNLKMDVDEKGLAKLNYYYNMNHQTEIDRNIQFGDILKMRSKDQNKYILCITPHCDCLHPDNINGLYFFVKGSETGIGNGLKAPDAEYISFIKSDKEEIVCIEWSLKPFTIYLCAEQRKINGSHSILYMNNPCKVQYVASLKDNYTQRISNQAFSHSSRVGIPFVKTNGANSDSSSS
ncbi:hypothetical protein MsAc7_15850 [Methanolapillus millepedarum]|uniref:Uncharacterized protein n=2 Tax=Methanolapillus millepedarum TaxID=3028296 RepID=A0AA96V6H3_9EURY|nr:hypothetical protein MsAc7_15850 [Methanosarcinaceae archaeon Ac7]